MSTGILAQAAATGAKGLQGVYFWSAVLIVIVLVSFAGYSYLRKWMRTSDEPTDGGTFTLADLRDLHRQGKMTDAEYEATKALLIGAAKKMADKMPPVLPRTPTRRPSGDGSEPPPADA